MPAMTPIKCFRRALLKFYFEDYSGMRHLYVQAANEDAADSIAKGLQEQHGVLVLDWDAEFPDVINAEERPRDTVRRLASELVERDKRTQKVREMVAIQSQDGNWDYSPYMYGMYNGLELALATMEARDPDMREAPDTYIIGTLQRSQSPVEAP